MASADRQSLLCVARILHDIGCAREFNGPQCFEVEGANTAADYLRQHKQPLQSVIVLLPVWC